MKISLLCVGEARGAVAGAIREYEERMNRYWRFGVAEVDAGLGRSKKVTGEKVKTAEEERLLGRLPREGGQLVALTREGRGLGSRELAGWLEECAVRSTREVSFVIGGAFGLGEGILQRADLRLSLSPMTLPHEVARLLLTEQLYRAGTILRNEPYHKGP